MKLHIFDLDGTIRVTPSGKPAPNTPEDQRILPNVIERIQSFLAEDNDNIAVAVSNQGGVSYGYMTERQAWKIVDRLELMLERCITDYRLAFFHPLGKFRARYLDIAKPKPDMINHVISDYAMGAWKENVLCIGNAFTDQGAAQAAGVKFQWAHEYFNWPANFTIKDKHGYQPKTWFAKYLEFLRQKDEENKNTIKLEKEDETRLFVPGAQDE